MIVILVITVAFAGCSEQKNPNSQKVSGIPGFQISIEKNISVTLHQRQDGSGISDVTPFYYVFVVLTNTTDNPINLKNYFFVISNFDSKQNTFVERNPGLSPFNNRPNLGPGASYHADPRDNGVYINYICGGNEEQYRLEIKKNSESLTYPPPPPITLYSINFSINGKDCDNLES